MPSPEEWAQIRSHVEHSLVFVRASPYPDGRILEMIATHHERSDGSGYPNKLKGDAIPILGRIGAIVDCIDAMTSLRHYAQPKSTYDAVRELKQLSGAWLQPELVELFIQ